MIILFVNMWCTFLSPNVNWTATVCLMSIVRPLELAGNACQKMKCAQQSNIILLPLPSLTKTFRCALKDKCRRRGKYYMLLCKVRLHEISMWMVQRGSCVLTLRVLICASSVLSRIAQITSTKMLSWVVPPIWTIGTSTITGGIASIFYLSGSQKQVL